MQLTARRTWILLIGSLALLVGAVYAPIVLAWSQAESVEDVAHFPGLIAVKPNLPMQIFSTIYFPLMTFHARLCGYGFVSTHQDHLMYARGYIAE